MLDKMKLLLKGCLLATLLFLYCGCGGNVDYYAQWEEARDQGNEELERQCLLHAIASGTMPEAHYQYAELCRKNENELGVAAWHYRQYAELMPDSPDAKEARKYADMCEKRQLLTWLRTQTQGQYSSLEEMTERLRLIEEQCQRQKKVQDQLEHDNQQLIEQLKQLRKILHQERLKYGNK